MSLGGNLGLEGRYLANFIGSVKMFNIKNALIDIKTILIDFQLLHKQAMPEIVSNFIKVFFQS